MAFSKITLNGTTLMDVTGDTVVANRLYNGDTATAANGEKITGTLQVSGLVFMPFRYGYYLSTGFGGEGAVTRIVSQYALPAGYYEIVVNDPTYVYTVYEYVSDTQGTLKVSDRSTSSTFESSVTSYITIRKNPLANILDVDEAGNSITIYKRVNL